MSSVSFNKLRRWDSFNFRMCGRNIANVGFYIFIEDILFKILFVWGAGLWRKLGQFY